VALCWALGRVASGAWVSLGPEGGDFLGTVTNPANPAQVTTIVGGGAAVYRTTSGGGAWSRIGTVGSEYLRDMSAFSYSKIFALSSTKCYRSDNGGTLWNSGAFPANAGWPVVIRAHPTNGNIVYAAGETYHPTYHFQLAFFKSLNGGQTWTATRAFSFDGLAVFGMAVARTNPNILYVCGWKTVGSNSYSMLLKSSNGGSSWSDISNALGNAPYDDHLCVAVDPNDANRVYVGGSQFYRSATNGASWVRVPSVTYTYAVAVDPTNSSKIYAASHDYFYRSTTWGQTWTTVKGAGFQGRPNQLGVASALPSNVYLSTTLGLWKSSDSGSAWVPAMHGMKHSSIASVAVSPSQPSTVFIAQEDASVLASYVSGNAWLPKNTFAGASHVTDLLIHPTRPLLVLAILSNYMGKGPIYRTGNSGAAWTEVDSHFDAGLCLAQDPSRPDVAYAGGVFLSRMSIRKSQDTGITWGFYRNLTTGTAECRDIAVAKSNYLFVYAVGAEGNSGRVFRSGNAGDTWLNVTNNLSSIPYTWWAVNAVAVHPTNQYKVFIGTTAGVYVSSNGGLTWSQSFGANSVMALAYDQAHGTLYAATEFNGVYFSKNEGGSWLSLNTGLGSLDGLCLGIDPVTHYLFVGNGTGGVWRTSLVP